MSSITYTLKADQRRNAADTVPGKGEAANVKCIVVTKSVTARTQNDTMKMVRLPSNARILGTSTVHWDDLASSGTPTMDIGVAPAVDPTNIVTADADALNDGLAISVSASSAAVIKDHANYGKQLWEHVAGLTADPAMQLDIYVSFVDAATNATGDVTMQVFYTLD